VKGDGKSIKSSKGFPSHMERENNKLMKNMVGLKRFNARE
jgi:hypothetical protein